MRPGTVLGALACLSTVAAVPPASASADIDWNRIDLAQERAAIENFQSYDQRLQDTGWRLAQANAGFCERVIPSIGLQLQDIETYGSPAIGRRALGLAGDFAVQTAARGSPAAATGAFARNREVVRIGAVDPGEWPVTRRESWMRLKRAHDLIDELLARDNAVTIRFRNGDSSTLEPVPACAARFELAAGSDELRATSTRVLVGIESEVFAYAEDEFAAAVAHELAHTLLDHTGWRDRNGRGRGNIRATEREADRLMPWLLANAGYDPRGAVRFFEAYRPTSGSVLFLRGSHEKWRTRAALVEAETGLVEQLVAETGRADWSTRFRREVDPDAGRGN